MIYELRNAIAYFTATKEGSIRLSPKLVGDKMKGQKALLIMKADYCGYCHRLLDTLQTPPFDNQIIFVMDQSDPINKKIMVSLGVASYPTIYQVDQAGTVDIQHEYEGSRDVEALSKLFQ
jgi:glutaredoxin